MPMDYSLYEGRKGQKRLKVIENYIRKTIIQNKYRYALNLLNDILATDILYNVKYALLKELLTHLINMEDKFKFNLLHITKTKKYGKIILFLNERTTKRELNGSEKNIYLLAEDILDITRTKIIPSQTVTYTDSLQEAIEGKNYKLILSHYPILMWNGQHKGSILLYGHTHQTSEDTFFQECLKERRVISSISL